MYSDKTVPGSNGSSNRTNGTSSAVHNQHNHTNGASSTSSSSSSSSSNNRTSSVHTMELTPQPDNYSCIKSCPHISSVLESKAKDTVFETYRQAVLISQPTANKVYHSKKDHAMIPPAKILGSKIGALKCNECHLNNLENSMICLQCPHVGCCFNNSNHSYSHYKSTKHQFSIDSGSGLLYCYKCNDFINHPDLERIRMKVVDHEYSNASGVEDAYYSDPSKVATRGLKGFVNLGATCFMSSILQTLIHNPIIKYHFFNNDLHYFNCERGHNQYVNNGFIDENNACITCSMDNIFQSFFTSDSLDGFALSNFLATSWHKKKSLAGFQEQDAHEFFQFLLNELHIDHSRIMTALGDTDLFHLPQTCSCISHSVYGFQLKSSIECASCRYVSNTMEHVNDLSLELNNGSGGLYDCLDQFTKEEKLEHYTCTKCSSVKSTTKTLKIQMVPAVLTLHLKRFKHDLNSTKIESKIEIPMFLNISKYCAEQETQQQEGAGERGGRVKEIYELFGVVVHEGSISTGHYTVYIKNSGQWYKCDDSVVSLVSQDEVLNSNAYLLFYIL
ncbi:Ubiquitin carboxyl-terminal hydrolase 8 [Candida viswanathii]|uniref:Ubiquitin carboxyl-terminal hydrolase n=1 Tax=Candida viswanathii TaxID=5486 RepID=A0A367XNQ9_9ASCO|nr:Ubiquitin carboxyl-terminal hydrolase 8 [Candida viswanathii]